MIARVFSLHWNNVDPGVVAAQKSVFDHLGIAVDQHKIDGFDHGEWIDWVMARMEAVDVFLFIDTDCIPLSSAKVVEGFTKAGGGALVGAEGTANHIDPLRSYAGAWYVFINRKFWDPLGRPSAKASPHNDVCQLWTDVWTARQLKVELIPPTGCIEPKWDMPGRPQGYGMGTTYGDHCFHLFEARFGSQNHFFDRCRQVTG